MQKHAGTFKVAAWEEQPCEKSSGLKLVRVCATMAYKGVIEGEGLVEFLMHSPDGRVTNFVGMEVVTGSIQGSKGSAVFQHTGMFADGVARSKWFVVPNSGTDGLRGLRGEGSYGDEKADAEHGGNAPMSFSFEFE